MKTKLMALAIGAMLCANGAAVQAANLVVNGSFETPPVTAPAAYVDYAPGSTALTGWTIANATVSQVRSDYGGNPGYVFTAQDGNAALDLTGFSVNQPTLVSQAIATRIGAVYALSFWVGNISGGPFGTQTAIGVEFSSGGTNFSCTNTQGTFQLVWQQCGAQFTASQTQTSIGFRNLDPPSDYNAMIDNVVVERVGGVPEPASWAMLITGFGLVGTLSRRRARALR
jgi:hypothetical protein